MGHLLRIESFHVTASVHYGRITHFAARDMLINLARHWLFLILSIGVVNCGEHLIGNACLVVARVV